MKEGKIKLSKDNLIYLEDYRAVASDGSIAKVFTGRDRGEDVRNASKIDSIEAKYDRVKIIIPNQVFSINPSFFEELFINVVSKLGKEKFRSKFVFESMGEYDYERSLSEAIARILRSTTAIG